MKAGHGWAWAIRNLNSHGWELCNWAEPTRETLLSVNKPSPEAIPVWVRITPILKEKAKARRVRG